MQTLLLGQAIAMIRTVPQIKSRLIENGKAPQFGFSILSAMYWALLGVAIWANYASAETAIRFIGMADSNFRNEGRTALVVQIIAIPISIYAWLKLGDRMMTQAEIRRKRKVSSSR